MLFGLFHSLALLFFFPMFLLLVYSQGAVGNGSDTVGLAALALFRGFRC